MKDLKNNLQQQDKIKSIKDYVAKDLKEINKILTSSLNQNEPLIKSIGDNIINAGGKRIRPILSLLVGYSLGFNSPKLYHLGAAIELIHTATLLHDDVIDESSVRRGRKTANALHDNKAAILVGDYIFAGSFKEMVKTDSLIVMDILANASSVIAQGEIMQLQLLGSQNFAAEYYFAVIKAKTAELFAAATHAAAILATDNEQLSLDFRNFGLNLGISFQIIDDLLDYTGSKNVIGKNPGDDFFEGKITLPIIRLYEAANTNEKELINNIFIQEKRSQKELNIIIKLLEQYDIFTQVRTEADNHLKQCYDYAKREILIQNNKYLLFILDLAQERVK